MTSTEPRIAEGSRTPWQTPPDRASVAAALRRHRAAIVDAWMRAHFDPDRVRRYAIAGVEGSSADALRAGYGAPLVELLVEYIRSGDSRVRDVYLDERLRYAPFRAEPSTRLAYFNEIIQADEAAVISQLATGVERDVASALLTELHAPLLDAAAAASPLRLLAVGDCLFNETRVFLLPACRESGNPVDMRNLYFSAAMGQSLDTDGVARFLDTNPMDLVALSFLSYEGIPAYRALLHASDHGDRVSMTAQMDAVERLMESYLLEIRRHTDATFVLHNASGLPLSSWRRRMRGASPLSENRRLLLDRLNHRIAALAARTPRTLLLDECAIANRAGLRLCEQPAVDPRLSRGAFFHTTRFGEELAREYAGIVHGVAAVRGIKVLAVDFDNTLWDGVMAEGAVSHFAERQRLLQGLRDAGFLLVAVSKNDPARIRWSEMLLQPDDFVALRISWGPKADAIREVAAALSLGLDAFLFIDDSPQERELVRRALPQVRILDAADRSTWRAVGRLLEASRAAVTDEARNRTASYREQATRSTALASSPDPATALAALELKMSFGPARASDLGRLTELVQRTNQFNTTGIRYGAPELRAMLEFRAHAVYVASVSDKFGDLGLVAAAIVERRDDTATIKLLVMSCRAMGLGVERQFLALIADAESSSERLVGDFVPSPRNDPAARVFADAGFSEVAGTWLLKRNAPRPPATPWLNVRHRE